MNSAQHLRTAIPASGFIRLFDMPALLGVSIATVNRWVKSGKLPAPTKLSERVTAFSAPELREWLEAQPKR